MAQDPDRYIIVEPKSTIEANHSYKDFEDLKRISQDHLLEKHTQEAAFRKSGGDFISDAQKIDDYLRPEELDRDLNNNDLQMAGQSGLTGSPHGKINIEMDREYQNVNPSDMPAQKATLYSSDHPTTDFSRPSTSVFTSVDNSHAVTNFSTGQDLESARQRQSMEIAAYGQPLEAPNSPAPVPNEQVYENQDILLNASGITDAPEMSHEEIQVEQTTSKQNENENKLINHVNQSETSDLIKFNSVKSNKNSSNTNNNSLPIATYSSISTQNFDQLKKVSESSHGSAFSQNEAVDEYAMPEYVNNDVAMGELDGR